MATGISPTLSRALRSGAIGTKTVPHSGHVMGPLATADDKMTDTSELDRMFGSLVSGASTGMGLAEVPEPSPAEIGMRAAAAPSGSSDVAAARPARPRRRFGVGADNALSEVGESVSAQVVTAAPERPEPPPAGLAPAAPARTRGRFGIDSTTPEVAAAPQPGLRGEPARSPQAPSRPWANLSREGDRSDVITVRKSMSAAKVLSPLVAAVSFHPGSSAPSRDRSGGLTELLVAVHQNAVKTANGVSHSLKEDVPSWMVTQLMQSYAGIMARRWERFGSVDPNALGRAMSEILENHSEEVAGLIKGASEDAYIEVNGPDTARYRIAVSVTSAAWALYDWVTHERLTLDASGDVPNEFYTYGLEPSEIVNRLLVRCVDECRALVIQNDSVDLRTAHMQSSINRMTQLVGAEYVTQTRQIMNWIGEEGIPEDQFAARLASASAELDSRILPHIFEWARVNFLRIEQGAFNAIEKLEEMDKASRSQKESQK